MPGKICCRQCHGSYETNSKCPTQIYVNRIAVPSSSSIPKIVCDGALLNVWAIPYMNASFATNPSTISYSLSAFL